MAEQQAQKPPPTLIGVLFNAIDSVARRIVSFVPLGRGVRKVFSVTPEGLIGWDHVAEIAHATLELQGEKPQPIPVHVMERYQEMLLAAQGQVADYTMLKASGLPERVLVFSQKDWIDANIVSFRFLFDPISEKYVRVLEEMGPGQGASVSRVAHGVLTIQVGIIMGYLARNVLGQFDLSLPEPEKGGKLYVVEPNISRVVLQMGFDPGEFRQWITLHEVTHSFEFQCNDWLRKHLSSSMQEYLRTIDWRGLSRPDFWRGSQQQQVSGEDALSAGGLISIISTPEQRAILARLQAIMCVLEGYSNHVMDRVGKELLSTYDDMKQKFERRREMKSGAEKLFQRLIGIDLKLEQYKLGQQFVDAVADREGLLFLNQVWKSPDNMPTMDEVRNPDKWIQRLKGQAHKIGFQPSNN
jgi:coenzyme F420 biosynthesis associated uncharacterized protein